VKVSLGSFLSQQRPLNSETELVGLEVEEEAVPGQLRHLDKGAGRRINLEFHQQSQGAAGPVPGLLQGSGARAEELGLRLRHVRAETVQPETDLRETDRRNEGAVAHPQEVNFMAGHPEDALGHPQLAVDGTTEGGHLELKQQKRHGM